MVSHFDEYVYIWFKSPDSNQTKDRILHLYTGYGCSMFGLVRIDEFEPKIDHERQNTNGFTF